MRYEGAIFRPPSEASSYILQATIGCSWNACTYCDMYRAKSFRVRDLTETLEDLRLAGELHGDAVDKIFVADGDALVMDLDHWGPILDACRTTFPRLRRISAYATAMNLVTKSPVELKRLRELGLTQLYIGVPVALATVKEPEPISISVPAVVEETTDADPIVIVDNTNRNEPEQNSDSTDDGKTVEEWIRVWDEGDFTESRTAMTTLAGLGEAAVPALTDLIQENHRHAGYAIKTLAEMGPAAQPALPLLLTLARNKSAEDPDGWTWNMPIRAILFMSLRKMSWASDQLVPLLEQVGKDERETDQIRGMAVNALRRMGPEALPSLRLFAISGSPQVRLGAVQAIVQIQEEAGQNRITTLSAIIDQDPFDSNVPTYLGNMKGIVNLSRIHPPTQRIKQLYRRELQENPYPQIAWQLATIIRNGLANTLATSIMGHRVAVAEQPACTKPKTGRSL